jgi:hypothetical protein
MLEKTTHLADEVERALPQFGLEVGRVQATYRAILYQRHRPNTPLELVVEMLLNAPELTWEPDDTIGLRAVVMNSLVQHLDSMYFVDTFEHDGSEHSH